MVAEPEGVSAPSGPCHHHVEKIAVTKDKLFELAVSLAAANISAGQFNNGMNFGTIVYDDTQTAYECLERLWSEISEEIPQTEVGAGEGGISH